jgi:hypothetical protein
MKYLYVLPGMVTGSLKFGKREVCSLLIAVTGVPCG